MPQLVTLQFTMPGGRFAPQTIALDASVNEQHGAQADATEHQVERGSAVNDYIRARPRRLTIEGVVTNTPLPLQVQAPGITAAVRTTQFAGTRAPIPPSGQSSALGSITDGQPITVSTFRFSAEFDRVKDVYKALTDASLAGALFTVTTTLASYETMALLSINAPRNAQSGRAIRLTLDFQELRFVETQEVSAPAPKLAKKSREHKAPEVVDPKEQSKKRSLTIGILNGAIIAGGGTPLTTQ